MPSIFTRIITDELLVQHEALLKSSELALKPSNVHQTHAPCVLVFYSHHRPHLAHRDMEFFSKAKERGWLCEEILTERFPVRCTCIDMIVLDDVCRYADRSLAHVP